MSRSRRTKWCVPMTVPVLLPRQWRLVDIFSFSICIMDRQTLAWLGLMVARWVDVVDVEDSNEGIKVPTSDPPKF